MRAASPDNPNICLDCDRMLLDDSPQRAAEQVEQSLTDLPPELSLSQTPVEERPRHLSEESVGTGTLA